MKVLKRLLLLAIVLPLALLLLVVVMVFTLDPNTLRPVIVEAAAARKIDLAFTGDLRWQFYPHLGVDLGKVSARTLGGQPLAEIGAATVNIRIMPLLRRELELGGFSLADSTAHYRIDAQGRSNWDEVLASAEADAQSQQQGEDRAGITGLRVNRMVIDDLTLAYENLQSQQTASIRDLNLLITDFSLTTEPFDVKLQLKAVFDDLPEVTLALETPTVLDLANKEVTISGARLQVSSGIQQATMNFDNHTSWASELVSEGKISLQPTSLRGWLNAFGVTLPPMANTESLGRMVWTSDYNYGANRFSANEMQLELDQTTFNGSLSIDNFSAPKIKSQWLGGAIKLDHYLPPVNENLQATQTGPSEPAPLPLAELRQYDLDVRVALQSVMYRDIVLSQPTLEIESTAGLVKLEELSTQVAEGQVIAQGVLDAREDDATLALEVAGTDIHAGELLATLADFDKLEGQVDLTAQVRSRGRTDKALTDNLQVDATVQADSLQVTPVNIERAYCQAMAVLTQQKLPAFDWPKLTKLEPVTVNLQLRGKELNLQNLNAQIAKLMGHAEGRVDTATGQFNIPIRLALGNIGTDIQGCLPIPEKWRTRELPIRCKGSVADLGLKTCLPDTELLTNLAKDRVQEELEQERARAREKFNEEKARAEERLKTKADELLEKNVKEEDREKIKDLLKQLKQ